MSAIESPISFRLGNSCYLARPTQVTIQSVYVPRGFPSHPPARASLLTSFRVRKGQTITGQTLQAWRTRYLDGDDTFSLEFLAQVLFNGIASLDEVNITADTKVVFSMWNTLNVKCSPQLELENGHYFVDDFGTFHNVWKIYEDPQLAFVQALWPSTTDDKSFMQVHAPGNGYRSHGVAVPSRSQMSPFTGTPSQSVPSKATKPLQGLRIAVKDNYHIRGTKTSLGNRAYFETCPVQDQSAMVVSRLIEAGANIVGKTHLSSFAMMEHPTQSVDFQAPFNPRGDGYLIPGGSSSGSAAAAAAYPWLDISICSDTTGSSRIPALQTGLFGFRPSIGAIPGDGMVKAWPRFDVPAWMGKDLAMFPRVFSVLADHKRPEATQRSIKATILYPVDFTPSESPAEEAAMNEFLKAITEASGYRFRRVSIKSDWEESAPVEEKDLNKYLHYLTLHGWFYSAYQSFQSFAREYENAHGYAPFTTEVVRWYWDLGSKVTSKEHQEIMRRLSIFSTWFTQKYMSDSSNLVALHIDKVGPKYRDQYPGNKNPVVPGLRQTYLSAILGAPELAIPISQLTYDSRITGRKEKIPMVVSLMGAAGTDARLLDWTLDILKKEGRPTKVNTGKTMF